MLPADDHVHSEWSWDVGGEGGMAGACERALAVGVGGVAFTEHLDFVDWVEGDRVGGLGLDTRRYERMRGLDVGGYLAAVAECRERYPGLRILSGVEVGEAHLFGASAAGVTGRGEFDRVLGSLHAVPVGGG